MPTSDKILVRIRLLIIFFIIVLIISGVTAFPVYTELKWAFDHSLFPQDGPLADWLQKVWTGAQAIHQNYPFLFYGYDWLAFAHLVIAMAFIGPYRDPVQNRWVIDWGIMACIAIIPLAVIAGPVRGIPWFHILIDCSFGIIGIFPLLITKKWINKLVMAGRH
jgi:hypothetical protein